MTNPFMFFVNDEGLAFYPNEKREKVPDKKPGFYASIPGFPGPIGPCLYWEAVALCNFYYEKICIDNFLFYIQNNKVRPLDPIIHINYIIDCDPSYFEAVIKGFDICITKKESGESYVDFIDNPDYLSVFVVSNLELNLRRSLNEFQSEISIILNIEAQKVTKSKKP